MDLAPGFSNFPLDSQTVFRACMNALARPATIQALDVDLAPPAPLTPELAAMALALADHETPLWLDDALRAEPAVQHYLAFHTGARFVERPEDAVFALVADAGACPDLASFAQGSDEYPDRSTTLLIAVERLEAGEDLTFTGPGIKGRAGLDLTPPPPHFEAQLRANAAIFPRGIDLVFTAPGRAAALPRSSRLTEEA